MKKVNKKWEVWQKSGARNFILALLMLVVPAALALAQTKETGVSLTITVGSSCGNGVVETGEQCEPGPPEDLNGATCVSRGYTGGTLSCKTDGSCAFNTSNCTSAAPAPSSGGGGGGGAILPPSTGVVFSGRAYPLSTVTLLKDAQIAASTIAGPDSNFQISLSGLSAGSYIFSLYGQDKNGLRSTLFTFSVTLTVGVTTNVSGIFIAPTISIDKNEVKKGDDLSIFGQTASQSEVTIIVSSDEEYFAKTKSDENGVYLYNFDTSPLDFGDHSTKAKAALSNSVSSFSSIILFKVGTKNVLAPKITEKILKGDINNEGRVNLIDFSIMAYWYQRPNPPAKVDLNGDGKVDLIDFSIMAYYWTG